MNLVDRFKNGDTVINCSTEAQANALFDWCTKNEIEVPENTRHLSFATYGETTCYRCDSGYKYDYGLFYSDYDFYIEDGYTVIKYEDFFEENTNMVKIKDIAEKYAEYEINEDKLKELLIKPKPKTIWDLECGDIYYFITSAAEIEKTTWEDYEVGKEKRNIGNCFLTREDAEFELERRKVETELLKYGGTRNAASLGADTYKWGVVYYHSNLDVYYDEEMYAGCCIYFKSEEDAWRAIDEIGEDRIKKYLFYVD